MKKVLALVILILLAGCNFNRPKGPGDGKGRPPGQKPDVGPVDFATVQSTVIAPKCASCHSNAGGNAGGANLETYANVKALVDRIQYRSLVKKDMPPVALSSAESNVLAAWIEQGAPEIVEGGSQKPEPDLENEIVNFTLVKDKIFAKRCLACHTGPDADDGVDLSDLPTVRFKANRIFQRIFVTKDMPIPPSPGLTPAERRTLLKWFDLGMPE